MSWFDRFHYGGLDQDRLGDSRAGDARARPARPQDDTLVLTAALDAPFPKADRFRRPARSEHLTVDYFSPNTTMYGGGLGREEAALARLQELARALVAGPSRGETVLTKSPDRLSIDPNMLSAAASRAGAEPRTEWRGAKAPSLSDLEQLAAEAFAALPDQFRRRCEGVAILVRDYPEQEVLDSLGLENEFDLLGLYEGVDLAQEETERVATDVNRIFLYRRPLLDYWCEHEETLGALITHVLVHEIGHHFGLSDAQMEAIEAAAG